MSTNAHIGLEHDSGKVEYIYNHWDGYIHGSSALGEILLAHYDSFTKVRGLIANGDVSSVGNSLDECTFYHHDRGEDWDGVCPTLVDSVEEYFDEHANSYTYLFTTNREWVVAVGGQRISLKEAVEEGEKAFDDRFNC